ANSCRSEEAEAYKYNGKEYEDSFGSNIYEMDLRQYDPAIGRWLVQDPVIHHEFSPYSAFDNNPVYWSDPSGADADIFKLNGQLVGASFTGQDAIDAFLQLIGESSSKAFEAQVQNTYELSTTPDDDGGNGGGNGNGGKNKGANSRGVGKTWWQTGLVGMSGYTFFGAPVRLIPYDFGASSYFGGAINVYTGTWKKYLKEGLDSNIGKHLMHEYGHYLQEKYGGLLNYY